MFKRTGTSLIFWCCLATLLTSKVKLSNAVPAVGNTLTAEGAQYNTANSNTQGGSEFTDYVSILWKLFQTVQNPKAGCANDSLNIICSILVKSTNSAGQTIITAVDYTQPMTVQQCAQQCAQTGQSCVAYEITNITTSVRNVYPVSNSSDLTGCNCPTVQTNCAKTPENVQLETTTPTPTTTTPTTTTTTPTTTTTTTQGTTRTYTAQDKGVAFTATSSQSFSQVGGVVPLSGQSDYNNHFSNNQFSAVAGGLHFVEVCAGVQSGTPVNVGVQGTKNRALGMSWNAKSQNGIQSPCRSGLAQLDSGSSVSVVLDGGVAYSDSSNLNSLTVFSLTDALNDDALARLAYAYAPNSPPIVNNTITPIQMKTVIAPSTAASFDENIASYTCGWTGPHIVSVSAGVMAGTPTQIQITNQDISAGLTRTTVKYDGSTTLSRNIVVNCVQGNKIQMNLVSGTVVNSDNVHNYNLTTFAVMPYIPRHVVSPVSWGVYKWYIAYNNEMTSNTNTDPLDPMLFTNVTVNQGNAYSISNRVLTVPSNGYYFTCITCGAGVGKSGSTFTMSLKRNNDVLIQIKHTSTYEGATDMFGRCAIVKLNAGDIVRPVGESNSYFYSSLAAYEVSWVGFKLADF